MQAERKLELSAWIADWQWRTGLEDWRGMADGLASVQAFAAYFDQADGLYFTEDMHEALPRIAETVKPKGLARRRADGS
ncbi:hypothetical protein [Paenibacillus sp. MBLB4367]|uniref:hypothetical protein n=1 Tax=Paenibacillus sp. MBLB4367 TaxID=3384767 RepID=UPI0039082C09